MYQILDGCRYQLFVMYFTYLMMLMQTYGHLQNVDIVIHLTMHVHKHLVVLGQISKMFKLNMSVGVRVM